MWIAWNPNPAGRGVGDCAVRAIARALGITWEEAYLKLAAAGYAMGDLPNSNSVWGAVLRQAGFFRSAIESDCPDCYTVADFAREHPHGVFVLGTGSHVVTLEDGRVYDSWDSTREIPQFFWYRKDD